MSKIKFFKPLIISSLLYLFLLIFITLKIYDNFDGHTQISVINYKILMIGVISLTMLPIIFYIYSEEEKNYYPIFYLIIIYFFLTYCSYYILDYDYEIVNDIPKYAYMKSSVAVYYSLKILFLGLTALNLGYFLCRAIIKKKIKCANILKISDYKEILFIFSIINFGTLFFFYFIEIHLLIPKIAQIKYPLVYFSTSLTFLLLFNSFSVYRVFALIPVLIFFCIELTSGSNVFPFMILFFGYSLFVCYSKKYFITPIIVILILGLITNSFKEDYRKIIWNPLIQDKSNNLEYKLTAFIVSFKNYYFNIENDRMNFFKEKVLKKNLRRINHSATSLVFVADETPEEIPYFNGESYRILATKIIPRFLWKDKPIDNLGNIFGKRYKALSETDMVTSWNMPTLNEFYANFGTKGVIVGMFIIGFVIRLLMNFFSLKEKNNYLLSIGFTLLYPFLFLETHLSLVIGASIQSFIFLIIMTVICKQFIIQIRKIFSNEKKNN
jgi:hypothetical protein